MAETKFIPDIPIEYEPDVDKLIPPLDIQNTTLDNFLHLLIKDKYTAKYSLEGLKLGCIVRVENDPTKFEYNPNVELETSFRPEVYGTRYKVFVYGEAGKIDLLPQSPDDKAVIDSLSDYYLSKNFTGTPSEQMIVYVDLKKRSIEYSLESTDENGDTGEPASAPNSKTAAAGPPQNSGPITIDKIPNDIIEDESWNYGKYNGKIKLKAVVSYSGQRLLDVAADKFNEMCKAAAKEGIKIVATSGHRKQSLQIQLYNDRFVNKYPQPRSSPDVPKDRRVKNPLTVNGKNIGVAAYPGWSNHQNGKAVDIDVGEHKAEADRYAGAMGKNPVFIWLTKNAAKYGFDNKEGKSCNEPWHWVYGSVNPSSDGQKEGPQE